jgi:hypothetical protein
MKRGSRVQTLRHLGAGWTDGGIAQGEEGRVIRHAATYDRNSWWVTFPGYDNDLMVLVHESNLTTMETH